MKKTLFAALIMMLPAFSLFSQESENTTENGYYFPPEFDTNGRFDDFDAWLRKRLEDRTARVANQRYLNGLTSVEFDVNADGSVTNVTLKETHPWPEFSKYVKEAVEESSRWWVAGKTKESTPVKVAMTVSVTGYLRDQTQFARYYITTRPLYKPSSGPGSEISARKLALEPEPERSVPELVMQPVAESVSKPEPAPAPEATPAVSGVAEDRTYQQVWDAAPKFIVDGKETDFPFWVQQNIDYTSIKRVKGSDDSRDSVKYEIIIRPKGPIEMKILSNSGKVFTDEVKRVVESSSSKWIPGMKNGKPITMGFEITTSSVLNKK